MIDTIIRGGKVVSSTSIIEASVAIQDGKIVAITENDGFLPKAKNTIDADGLLVMPGLIDVHVHTWSEDYNVTSKAAAYGGLTSVIFYVRPEKDKKLGEAISQALNLATKQSVLDFGFHVYIFETPNISKQIQEVIEMGVPSVKLFMAYKKRGMMASDYFILEAMKCIHKYKGMTMVHAENGLINDYIEDEFLSRGKIEAMDFPDTCPSISEGEAINRVITLAAVAGCPLYIVHLSTEAGLQEIAQAQKRKQKIFTETCPQYLLLTRNAMKEHGPLAKIGPPLRTEKDTKALWDGLREGTISIVSSDHASYTLEAKKPGYENILDAPFGAPGVETIAPLMINAALTKNDLGPCWLARAMSEMPAKIFGLFPRKGAISVGSDADLVLIDPKKEVTLDANKMHMAAGYTLYQDWRLKGWPVMTMVRGETVLENGVLKQNSGFGKFLVRGSVDL